MSITNFRKKYLAFFAVIAGFSVFQTAAAQAACTPIDGGSGAVIAGSAGSTILSIDVTTGKYTQIASVTAQVPAAQGINSVANNPNNSLIYFTSNSSVATNNSIFFYNLVTGATGILIADVTLAATGITLGTAGLGSGSAFYDTVTSSLFIGVERPAVGATPYNSTLYRIPLNAAGTANSGAAVVVTNDATNWGDIVVSGGNVHSFGTNGATTTVNYKRYSVAGVADPAGTVNLGTTPTTNFQVAFDRLGNAKAISSPNSTVQTFNVVGSPAAGLTGAPVNITSNGTTLLATNSINDAASCTPAIATIGDTVWTDLNADGIQQAGEVGIAGVTVELYSDINGDGIVNGSDALLSTTTTDAAGLYSFPNVLPGQYTVKTVPGTSPIVGLTQTNPGVGGANSRQATISTVGALDLTADFGYRVNADLQITKTNGATSVSSGATTTYTIVVTNAGPDTVLNSVATDPAVAGLNKTSVTCTGAQCPAAANVTKANLEGAGITIPSLASGQSVTFAIVADVTAASGSVANTATITGPIGHNDPTPGNNSVTDTDTVTPKSVITGNVYYDKLRNNTQDGTDTGIQGVQLELRDAAGNPLPVPIFATTDVNGNYTFTVPVTTPNTVYTIVETQPANYGSSENPTNSATVTAASGAVTGPNFGETKAQIAGTVFRDDNNNGIQDGTEPGIQGVTVTVSGTDVTGATLTGKTAITDVNGNYTVLDLFPADATGYTVTETQPAAYADGQDTAGNATTPGTATNGTTPATQDTITGVKPAVGQAATGYNYGERPTGSITGNVYFDKDKSGTKNAGDTNLGGVTITLKAADGVTDIDSDPNTAGIQPTTTTTDASGNYSFSNLAPGTYKVLETQPAGYGSLENGVLSPVLTVPLNAAAPAANFGEIAGSLTGVVYRDDNNNGTQNALEPGIAGVVLTLSGTDAAGIAIPAGTTATTDANGQYTFNNVLAANGAGYTISEIQPAAYSDGLESAGTPAGNITLNDVTSSIPLAAAQDGVNYNFGERGTTLTGKVYIDKDKSSNNNAGDTNLGGVLVTLKDGAGADIDSDPNTAGVQPTTSTTAADGTYSFPNLPAGTYTVVETQPTGYGSSENPSNSVVFPLVAGTPAGPNFGETVGSLSGVVFRDDNNNGTQDVGEPGIAGVVVTLTGNDATGTAISAGTTATTDASGNYKISNLLTSDAAGYTLTETQPSAYSDGKDALGNASTAVGTLVSPDADTTTGIKIGAGQDAAGYTYGEIGTSIRGTVFYDKDKNSAQNGTEPGIAGVTVTLKDGAGNDIDSDPATAGIQPTTTTTAADGSYSFPNLPAGSYQVNETQPTGYGSSTPNSVPVTLVNGTPATTNFGDTLGSLSGRVFRDDSNEGTQDAGEPGIAGVIITLKDSAGNDVDSDPITAGVQPTTATTDLSGVYKFSSLPAGTYNVVETQPSLYADGIDKAGSVGGTPTAPDTIASVTLPAGTDATNYTFGELGSSVTGTIYQDKDKNGTQNGTDPGIAGVVVTLKDSAGNDIDSDPNTAGIQATTATTDATGKYSFPNLPAGSYQVVETQPTGYANGLENPGTTVPVTVATGTPTTLNFGETLGSLSGVVYNDTDGNGTQNGTEPGVSGVTITLKDGAGNDVDSDPVTAGIQPTTTTTDSSGQYSFKDLKAGTYNIVEPTQPAGYTDGLEKLGNAATPGTLPAPDNDTITGVGLNAGQDATGYLFGEKGTGITGTVYRDDNRNSSLSAGEPGIAGVLLTLKDSTGADIDSDPGTPGIQPTTTTTDSSGNYSFPSVPAGTYTIVETQPNAYTSSENGTSAPVTVVAGTPSTINFGELPAVISGTVFNDKNNDGIQDVGEFVISGVTVTLKDNTGADIDSDPVTAGIQPTTAITDGSGNYKFNGLPAGTYSVVETQPTAFSDGKDAVGNFGGAAIGTLTAPDSITAIVTPAGAVGTGYNFGERGQTISGQVFVDSNANGTPDALEKPLGGVTVTLKDAAGNDVDSDPTTPGIQPTTATTAPDGTYSFPNLPAGNYNVVETQPVAYGNGTPNTVPVTLTTAAPATVNFGEKPASIAGTVFNDKNNDGIQDAGETGISSVALTLKDSAGADIDSDPVTAGIQPTTVTTDASGNYKFANLPAATYQIVETQPSSYSDGTDAVGTSGGVLTAPDTISSINLPAGIDATKYTFGERGSSITGTVYVDSNNSGTLQPSEPKLGGVLVTLKDGAGNDIDSDPTTAGIQPTTATTAPDGTYSFPNIPAGTYSVVETQPAAYANGTPNTVPVTVTPGVPAVADFGEKPSSISGKAFIDTNNNGTQDALEPNEPGVTITLKDGAGNDIDSDPVTAGVQPTTTITAADGTYSFPNLPAGSYNVVETQPIAYGNGTPNTVSVTLTPGNPGIANFGDVPSSLAGLVFNDINNNGTQQAGELGLSGVTITLKDAAGNDIDSDPVAVGVQPTTALTDGNGNYKFINLPAATYGVVETQPAGYNNGTVSAGSSGGTADTANNKVTGIVLAAQTDATAYNFAEVGTPITGRVYKDVNANGVDNSDPGIAGVTVNLKNAAGTIIATTTTDATGNYSFPPQPAGTYTIEEVQPAGYGNAENPSNSVPVTVTTGQPVPATNFGETIGSLSGKVYRDDNNDGIRDGSEFGIAGVTVTLSGTGPSGAITPVVALTDALGNYSFPDVLAGNYTITETQPTNYSDGKDSNGTPAGTAANDSFSSIPLTAGQNGIGFLFGERGTTISGVVYNDANKDSVKQATEPGLGGVLVTLKDGAGNDVDSDPNLAGIQPTTAITDGGGQYAFPNLPAGNYTVVETQPAGTGSSENPTNNVPVTLVAGAPQTVNFGDTFSSISGQVYFDANGNNAKDPTEVGIAGVTVTLTGTDANGASVNKSATTDASGNYSFKDLTTGTYTILETQPSGYTDGAETNGTPAGTITNDKISNIPLSTVATDATGYLFGETGTPVAGRVFVDTNNNGVQDPGELGLPGQTVTLTPVGGGAPITATTDANGDYNFGSQPAGDYTITESQPTGYGSSTPNTVPVTVTAGAPTPLTNFGDTPTNISGKVFRDDNNNGIQDGSEPGLAGVTVTITGTDALNANITKTATTDATGAYSVKNLLSGTYTVTETQPATYQDGKDTNGTPAGTVANDSFSSIVFGDGQSGVGYNFGELGTTINGKVFVDTNKNGTQDPTDLGKPGVVVTLKDGAGNDIDSDPSTPGVQSTTTTTGPDGSYSFPNLPSGTYTVVETQPTGFGSSPTSPNSVPVTLLAGTPSTVNFADTLSSFAGTVYNDTNNDGVKDPTESGISNVTVTLTGTDANGASVTKTATTDASGNYSFPGLLAGTYTITETQPAAYNDGKDTNGTPAGTLGNDVISSIVLPVGTDGTGYLFGETGTPITGTVYIDANKDSTKQSGEAGIPGVALVLKNAAGTIIASTVTDANGNYSFPPQPAGTYTVVETQPAGYGNSENPTNIAPVTVTAGQPVTPANFGETTSSLSGTVFRDDNNDGVKQASEPGIAGVTVTITGKDVDNIMVNKPLTTDANGVYSTNDLKAGTYTISETQPTAYNDGKDTVGTIAGTPTGTLGNDSISSIAVGAGVTGTGYNFGELGNTINGQVFKDTNADSIKDPTETGLGGVIITLKDVNGNDIDSDPITPGVQPTTTTTAPGGTFSFPNLPAGDYRVVETQPNGLGSSQGSPDTVLVKIISGDPTTVKFADTPSSIAGSTYVDSNNNGLKDSGEAGIANVTVTLTGTDANGAGVTKTTTSDASGNWKFTDLLSGTYTVEETQPTAYSDGKDTDGSIVSTVGNDQFSNIVVPVGTNATGYLFGESGTAIAGKVYLDANRNGADNSEPGIGGVTVELKDSTGTTVATTTTAPDGTYSFPPQVAGNYTVVETQPAGYGNGLQNPSNSVPVTVVANQPVAPVVFGEVNSSLSGTVYRDDNNDGVKDGQEFGIPGVTVTVTGTDANGATITPIVVITNAQGDWTVPNLLAGTYTVTEIQPAAYGDGKENPGTPAGNITINDVISSIPLTGGAQGVNYNFGERGTGIAGVVYNDANKDGSKQPTESGLGGVVVTLKDGAGKDIDSDPAVPGVQPTTAITDGDGQYNFPNLPAGTYTVVETQPAGTGSSENPSNSVPVTLVGGTPQSVNFGDTFSSLSGQVYNDVNSNDAKDPTEPGLSGVTVTLTGTDANGQPVNRSALSDASGNYSFKDLTTGTYTITETQPAAYTDGAETNGTPAGNITVNDVISSIPITAPATDATGYLFGEKGTPVAGAVFLDRNKDGIQQPDEPGVPGVTLTLTPVAGGAPVTVVTDPNGNYTFGNVPAGNYTITETQPVGLGSSTPNVLSVTVTAGGVVPAVNNFGDTPASLTGKVFRDDNNNGTQDASEPGIVGATVTVTGTDATGTTINKTVTTDANGNWIVDDLKSGTYTVVEIQPAAYTDGKDTNGTPAGTAANDSFSSIALTPGQAGTGYLFGELGTSINGKVFVDTNKDGTQQGTEPGKPGVIVTLKDAAGNVVATTTTGPDGSYSFPNLPAGNYTVVETQPNGLGSSTPDSLPITVTPGTPSTANFADTLSSFTGTVYNDTNNDGVKDPTESGISNVTVTLTGTDANGASVTKTATTDANGNYSFPGLLAGTYTITETQPAAYNDGKDTNGTPAGTLGNDVISSIVLPVGTDGTGYLFGETGTPITGTVYKDNNLDGVKQPSEPGLPGVIVVLKNAAGTIIASTVTDSNGNYSFPPQPAGTYTVEETQPVGYGSSTPNSVPVTITAGQPVTPANFGETPSSLSGAVFRDDNNDGVKQASEPGLPNATVLVTGTDVTGNNVSITTTTDANGNWTVNGLKAGTYTISETQPTAYNDGKDTNGTPAGTLGNDIISSIKLGDATTAVQGTGYNFGELGNTINGQVFKDSNANGTLDPNETGVPGVLITLKDVNGNDIDSDPTTPGVQPTTTITKPDGTYSFPNLPAGNYKVVETQPNGLGSSTPNTVPVDVRNGNPTTVLFGDTPSSIAGVVFDDTNNSGIKDPGENGIAGVVVTLTGKDADNNPVSLTTTTDINGDWKFGDLVSGTYTVKETQPASFVDGTDTDGSIPSTLSNDQFANIALPIGTNANNYRFAEQTPQTGTVTGLVFKDLNGDGVKQPNEPGIPGATVTLTPTGGTPIVVTTNADGTYSIPNAPVGAGTVTVTNPAGTKLTTNNNPQPVTVPAGSSVAATPIGYQPLGTINGKVFNDLNGDGKQDPNEPGIPGATVTVTTPDGKTITVITDKDGNYTIPNVPVGNNQVVVTKPDGTILTTGNNPQTITVTPGQTVTPTPVGFQGKGALIGVVFDDKNGDKIQQPSEPGIAGAVVTIKDAAGNDIDSDPATAGVQPTTTTTDANGKYSFPSLPAGPVQVVVTPPSGYVTTTPERNPQTVTIPTGGTVEALPIGLVKPSIAIVKNVMQGDTVIPAEQQRPEVMVGSTLRYQIKITNDGAVTLKNIKITDTLPLGLAYIPGSSSLVNSSLKLEEPIVTNGTGVDKDRKVLTYNLPATIRLEPGQSLSLRLTTVVTPSASTSNEVINKAKASASAGTGIDTAEVNSDTAIAAVKVNLGVFQTPNVIAGRVYFDRNNDNNYTSGIDAPLPGARVYLSDGRFAVTDANGNYSIPEITPGVYAIRLDPITAPYPVKHVPDDQGAPGTRYVKTSDAGGISNEDFILLEPSAAAVKARSTTAQRGPVTLTKSLVQGGAGYAVNEVITLEKAVSNLSITDPLPNGSAERGPITITDVAGQALKFEVSKDGKTITIPGTIPAGTYKITYAIFTALPPDQVITDPDIDYEEILLGAFPAFETSRTSDEVTR